MKMYTCQKCKRKISETETDARDEEVISVDRMGRFIGSTILKTCVECVRKEKSAVVDTVEKKPIRKDQARLF